jgi:hypothetical protein
MRYHYEFHGLHGHPWTCERVGLDGDRQWLTADGKWTYEPVAPFGSWEEARDSLADSLEKKAK